MQHSLIQAGFILLTLGSFTLLFLEIKKAVNSTEWSFSRKKKFILFFLICLIGWTLFVSIWSLSGRMINFSIFPFNMAPVLAIPFIAIIAFTFSKSGREILVHIPTENIIRLQAFRFFVELLLWALYLENQAPLQMTFEGRNWDVLSGISAPIIAFLIARSRLSKIGVIIWNIACLALLVNIVAIAILSMPTPLRTFMNEPSNTIVTLFPVSWLPGLLVPLAYGLHFLSLRQLSIKNK
ncbi:MAG TPA: hypothetical protein VGQ59_19225 [Cyclobacteriaceae bacterium]|nr:hypothetical protein [Cyclobacteriaceae bacterium]